MKFGLNYNKHMLPKWSEHYIDYNGLRMQLRAKTQRGESIEELTNKFIAEIVHAKDFFTNRFGAPGQQRDTTVDLAGQGQPPRQVSGYPAGCPPVPHSSNVAGSYVTYESDDVCAFGKLNMIAARRLLDKFEASCKAPSHALRQAESELEAWTEARQKADELLINAVELKGVNEEHPSSANTLQSGDGAAGVTLSDQASATGDEVARLLEPQPFDEFELALSNFVDQHANSVEEDQSHFSGRLLYLAASCLPSNFVDAILKHGPDLGVESSRGETAIYCAAQSGLLSVVQSVAEYFLTSGGGLNSAVPRTGWTPLMVACANGYTDIVEFLLSSGADAEMVDVLGWTAREHAAYRGHLTTASLDGLAAVGRLHGELTGRVGSSTQNIHHTLAAGEKAIVVTLGSVQGGHGRKTLKLRPQHGRADSSGFELNYLEIIINGADCGSKIVQLPLWGDYSVDPLVGRLDLDAQSQVTVRLWHGAGTLTSLNTLVSSGTVLLGDDYARFGASRESMLRETTVIMLDKETMEFAGSVLLSYVIATPFQGLADCEAASYRRESGDPVRLVGHRGLGQNTAGKSNLQIGENTVTSFLSAYRLGAPFVEFDVQLTRDLEAVIYHDFSFSGSGSDVPIHDISLAQYKYAGDIQSPSGALLLESGAARPRASSTGEDSVLKAIQAQERLRYTVDFDGKGFKANIRGHSIQDAHATLEELLVTLPEEIGFNIEMKYQRLHEAVEAGVASVTIDINTFVDVALEKIKRLAGRRPIILSSFTPEVCILLKLKQNAYPVMLITNAGQLPTADKEVRAASLQMGLQFARHWRLAGLVLACDAFLLCPRLISLVKSAGLVCASYGLGNNEPENAKIQADAGIDILIVDKVKLIADALSKLPSPEA